MVSDEIVSDEIIRARGLSFMFFSSFGLEEVYEVALYLIRSLGDI
ncbi:hypothetical protein VCRA2119O148_330007 [Vibrio crassostreae]|nr:hypothetical protein VCRA2119O148_330007 [Vibrio crassostreae]